MAAPIITFTSDFGLDDWFVGVVHGVIRGLAPDSPIIDLSHTIEPGNVERAAFVLEASAHDFPAGTIHLAVVDPGVGTARRALAVSAHRQHFVGPDNGILEWALSDEGACAHELLDERYFRVPMSRTFHGRDVFAPVAAHLALGVRLEALGPAVPDAMRLPRTPLRAFDARLEGRVMYIDRFGNALTNLTAERLAGAFPGVPECRLVVELVGHRVRGVAGSYGDAPIGTLVALVGSSGRLEIAQVGGHAAIRFGFGVDDPVTVWVGE